MGTLVWVKKKWLDTKLEANQECLKKTRKKTGGGQWPSAQDERHVEITGQSSISGI